MTLDDLPPSERFALVTNLKCTALIGSLLAGLLRFTTATPSDLADLIDDQAAVQEFPEIAAQLRNMASQLRRGRPLLEVIEGGRTD